MKQLLTVLLALLFYVSSGLGQQPASQAAVQSRPSTASTELVTLTKTWTDAMNAKDHAKIEQLVAPEFALYRWNGEPRAPGTGGALASCRSSQQLKSMPSSKLVHEIIGFQPKNWRIGV